MSVTNYMNLTLPTVSVTLGPDYATQNNEAFEAIDEHNHTSGSGRPVPTAGLDINANLTFNSKKAYNLYSAQFIAQGSTLTGAGNALSVYTKGGDLYYTNASGTTVQLTDGASVVTSPGVVNALEYLAVSSDVIIGAGDTYVILAVDTSVPRTITLPLAANVAAGRIYIVKDISGTSNTNAISVARQGSDLIDGASSQSIASNYGSVMYTTDGVSNWYSV